MAFWLSAALLNIFGRGSRSPGAVPENRTWTTFSGASSDTSSEAAAAAAPGLVRIPAGRRPGGAEAGAMSRAPARTEGTFPEPLDGIFGASLANDPAPWCSSGAQGCTPGEDRASPRPRWGPTDPSPGLRGTSLSLGHRDTTSVPPPRRRRPRGLLLARRGGGAGEEALGSQRQEN